MSESIKTGGVGKSPAIEKINRLNEVSSRMQAAALLERKAFSEQQEKAAAALLKRQQIIEDFQISFKKIVTPKGDGFIGKGVDRMNAIFHKDAEGCSQEQVCVFTWTDPKQRLSLVLPEGFQEMEEEKREEYFSMEERPEIIMEDEQGSTQFTLQFLNKAMSREETKEAVRGVCELTQKIFVQYKTSPLYLYEKSEIPVGWFCMSMKALKREHIKAVFSIENRMVLLTLTYPEEERVRWQVFARYLFDSLHQEKKGGRHMEQITNDDLDVFLIQIKKNLYKGQTKDRQSNTSAFARVNLGLGFEFLLPAGFGKADDQTAAGIFWSEKRPPNIFINEQKDAGFTLQILEEPETEPLNHNRENIKLILEKIDRRVVFYDQGEEKGILWFDYKGFAGNEVIYNLIFLFQIGEEKVLGSFFCPFEAYDRWRPVVFEVLSTVRKEEADEGI